MGWFRVVPVAMAALSGAAIVYGSSLEVWWTAVGLIVGGAVGLIVGWLFGAEVQALRNPAPAPADWARASAPPLWVVLFVLAMLLLASTAFSRIDAVLHAFHVSGDASFGIDAAAGGFVLNPPQRALLVSEAVQVWARDAAARQAAVESPLKLLDARSLMALQLSFDSFALVPGYAVLLVLLLGALRRLLLRETDNIKATARTALLDAYLGLGKWALVALVVATCADWIENGLALVVVRMTWPKVAPTAPPILTDLCVAQCAPLAVVLWASTWLKSVGLVLVLGYVLAVGLLMLQHAAGRSTRGHVPRLRATLLRLLLPAGLIATLMAVMFSNDQAPDVLRRWTRGGEDTGVIVFGILLTLLLGLAVGLSAWWLLLTPQEQEDEAGRGVRATKDERTGLSRELTPLGWWFFGAGLLWYAVVWLVAWQAANGWLPAWAPVAVGVVGFLVAHDRVRSKVTTWQRALWLGIPGLALLSADMWLSHEWKALVPLLVIVAVVLLGLPFLSWPIVDPIDFAKLDLAPKVLAAFAPLTIGLALFGAGLDVSLYHLWRGEAQADTVLLLILGLGLILVAPPLVAGGVTWEIGLLTRLVGRGKQRARSAEFSAVLLMGGVTIWLIVVAWLASGPDQVYSVGSFGLLAVLCGTFALIALVGTGLVALVEEAFPDPLPLFRMFGLDRTPVVPIVLAWAVVVAVVSLPDKAHDVRIEPPAMPEQPRSGAPTPNVQEAFKQWQTRLCLLSADTVPAGEAEVRSRPVVPLVVVATAGGGIRAAAWTTYVLDQSLGYKEFGECPTPATDQRRSGWVFAMSGISGGSVGLATYAARQGAADLARAEHRVPPDFAETADTEAQAGQPLPPDRGWVRTNFGVDTLSPTVSWMLLVESQWSLLRFPLNRDRAAVLEVTFERWPGVDPLAPPTSSPPRFFDLQARTRLPLLLLNGTSVETGCRFNGSVLRTAGDKPQQPTSCVTPVDLRNQKDVEFGATVDLVDFMCEDQDPRLSTVALLSARFPYVSPSGGLEQCTSAPKLRTFVVDGGYHEGSGMATMLDTWMSLAQQVADYNSRATSPVSLVPMLLQIDNGYDEPVGPGTTPVSPQLLVPPATALAARGAVEARARQEGQIAFTQPYNLAAGLWFCGPRYAHFALRPHPGPSAPLGWVLSDISFDDFVRQLGSDPTIKASREIVNGWFDSNRLLARDAPNGSEAQQARQALFARDPEQCGAAPAAT